MKTVDIRDALDLIKSTSEVVSKKSLVDQSDCILFFEDKICSFNGETCIIVPFDSGINCAVPMSETIELFQKIKEEAVKITVDENQLLVTGRKFKSGIKTESDILFDVENFELPEKWNKLPNNFNDGLVKCVFGKSQDNLPLAVLNYVHATGDFIESCDNFRLARYKLAKKIKEDMLIPVSLAKSLNKLGIIEYASNSNWLFFKNESNVIVASLKINDEFPDMQGFLSDDGVEISFPNTTSEVVLRAAIFAKKSDSDKMVTARFEKDTMYVRGENNVGWYEEKIKLEHTNFDEEIKFLIGPEYLNDLLAQDNKVLLTDNTIKFENESYTLIVALAGDEDEAVR